MYMYILCIYIYIYIYSVYVFTCVYHIYIYTHICLDRKPGDSCLENVLILVPCLLILEAMELSARMRLMYNNNNGV